jgi:hypothetical protein
MLIERYAALDSPDRATQLMRMTGYAMPTWQQHFEIVDRWLAQLASDRTVKNRS